MMTLLDDKVVFICGGGQGLGLAAIPFSLHLSEVSR